MIRGWRPLLLSALLTGCTFDRSGVPAAETRVPARETAPASDLPSATPPRPVDPLLPFGAPRALSALNTSEPEDDPALTGDMLEIYFERSGDIWRATRASVAADWDAPQPVAELNTSGTVDATPGISSDGLIVFLDSTRRHANGCGGSDLYVATRPARGDPFGAPLAAVELNTASSDLCAYPLPNKLTLVMDSDRPGGRGLRDLYFSTRASTASSWATPRPITGVNSDQRDECPWINPELTVLFFASRRDGGAGGTDIWVATRQPGGGFAPPVAVKGINTDSSESDPWLSPDLKTIYFTSDRDGNSDLFAATR